MDSYLKVIEQIGEGAFSKLYSAYDFRLNKQVALKIEKNDKKTLLQKEFEIYTSLQNLSCIPKIYNYIKNITNEKEENKQLNCLEMELLGKNLLLFKRTFNYYNNILAYDIIFQCLNCIQKIHNFGIIHRDIKPSNFCLYKEDEKKIILNYKNNVYFKHDFNVYLIDFGLVRKINEKGIKNNEVNSNGFIGTLTYASLSAHNKEELSKKDDLWSFFFMLLELLNEQLPWRNCSLDNEKEIIEMKIKCINEPEKYLFLTSTKNNKEIINIFNYIKNLKSDNEPDYQYIFNQLSILKNKEIQKIYYNYEIKNQILNLQKNLMTNNSNQNHNIIEQNNKPLYQSSEQDYIIYKLGANNKSIPSLYSTNYSSSIYYKTNYINCISKNNNENFYQSVLKMGKINNKKYYDFNSNINLHPFKYKDREEKDKYNKNTNNNIEDINHKVLKFEKKNENDKSLIEFLIGKSRKESPKKEKEKHKLKNKNDKKCKYRKLNIHNKRKSIIFNIVKKKK